MFGRIKAKRQKKENQRQAEDLKKQQDQFSEGAKAREAQESAEMETKASEKAQKSKEERNIARKEGQEYMDEFFSRPQEGLTPEQKRSMQFEAKKQIQRGEQAAQRKLLGNQGMRGITGRSGVAYAQQRDLNRQAQEAQGAAQRDVNKYDYDLALKKQAAKFSGEQGEASQAALDKQLALDELRLENERKRQRQLEDQYYQQFTRV
jgi:hypothetical protein